MTDEQMRVSSSATEYTDKGIKVSGVLELWHSSTLAEQSSVGGLSWRLTTRRSRSSRCITPQRRPAERW